ncbi:NAD(P)/FAD-dependent oxidoreductase [Ureaplasma zalophigenitalium]|uniref:NAD(P)/FAD-dependent oxidoreductase n=1 Tax=Ureaplasma zalophigenitalium TaxID=907723 RepID=A0ABT3BPV7_9BACT|nr:NAD(P)/FAD-dependent oxidoreductase [Ureaplasma zalophigenitalium]MCV3754285.1 NAD(P)/FAD-dependent oxidoreductase [Ureaplasma zalophigenitalium]
MIYDVVIIGAGPIGLFTGAMSGYFQLKTLVLEASDTLGGQISYLYENKEIYDVPGYPKIIGKDYVQALIRQIKAYEPIVEVKTGTSVFSYKETANETFLLFDEKEQLICEAKFMILAFGKGDYIPIKLENIINEQKIKTKNILYSAHKNEIDFNNKKIVVLGGGDSALDNSVYLKKNYENTEITIVVRNDIKGNSFGEEELISQNIQIFKKTKIDKIEPNKIFLEQVIDENTKSEVVANFDYILVQYGSCINQEIAFANWKSLELNTRNRILVNSVNETSLKRVYAIGDCCFYDTGINNQNIYSIITGQADGFKVLQRVKQFLKSIEK